MGLVTLRDIHLQQTYDSGKAGINPVTDFFEPCLENSVAYAFDSPTIIFSESILWPGGVLASLV